MNRVLQCISSGVLVMGAAGAWAEEAMKLPPLKKQPTEQRVIDEHLDALNKCDWNRLMAQYPKDVEIHLPDGQVVKGREKVGELFAGFCKKRPQRSERAEVHHRKFVQGRQHAQRAVARRSRFSG